MPKWGIKKIVRVQLVAFISTYQLDQSSMFSEEKTQFDRLMQEAMEASKNDSGEAAIALFMEAGKLIPQAPLPHFLAAAEFMELGRVPEAESAYANTVLLAPDFAIARFQLGLLQFTSARAAMAMLTWQPLLNLADDDCLKLFVLGFSALAQDDFPNALAYMQNGMDANHSNPPLNQDIARVMEEIRKVQITGENQHEQEGSDHHILLANYQQYGAH